MRFTNDFGLPEAIVQAVKRDTYHKDGHLSVTELVKPPQMVYLEREHDDEIVVDVAERMWLLLGSCVHAMLERALVDDALQEERLRIQVSGWTITGKPDLYERDGTLTDFKVPSVYSFLLGDKEDWEAQLNCYGLLLKCHGFAVKRLQVAGILRDWMQRRAESEEDYPPVPFALREFPLWPDEVAREYVKTRVELHKKALEEGTYPECTKEERWHRGEAWAVKKKGNKQALRVFNSENEAELWAYDYEQSQGGSIAVKKKSQKRALRVFDGPDAKKKAEAYADKTTFEKKYSVELEVRPAVRTEIEHRPGEDVRCDRFCHAAPWCLQAAKKQEAA